MNGKIILHMAGKNPSKARPWLLASAIRFILKIANASGAGDTATGKFWNLYPHLCLETLFPALKLTQNC